jgi:putative ABC transport system permease protein
LVAVVAGGASIFIVMFMSVTERRREFGILKASGWSNRNIILSVVIESLSIALMGFAFGIILGLAANLGINHYLGEEMASLTPLLIVEILAFGIGMGIIGGLYPAIRATRVSPIEALRAL